MKEYRLLYDALRSHRDLIDIQTTIMEAELFHGRSSDSPSIYHVHKNLPSIPIGIHITVHKTGLQMIESLPLPADATHDEMTDVFINVLVGPLGHWEDLRVGELSLSEIARDGLAKNPVLLN